MAVPTFVIDSGHGLYGWWLFDHPRVLRDVEARAAAHRLVLGCQQALRQLAAGHGWTVDPTGDLARVLRLPGTTNWKVEGDPRPVRVLHHTGKRYHPKELFDIWGKLVAEPSSGPAPPLPERVLSGHRTKSVESLAGTLRRRNIVQGAAEVAALEHNRLVCDPPLPEAKVLDTVRGIYKRYEPGAGATNGQTPANGKAVPSTSWAELVPLAKIERRPIRFLWAPAIIRGGITLLAGDPGKGKGLIASALAAGVSAGVELPGRQPARGGVLWVTFEEAWEFAIAPRLDVAGCDESSVYRLVIHREGVDQRRLTRSDIPLLRDVLMANRDIVLVVLDPVLGFVSGETNINQQNEVRDALNPMVDIADDLDLAVLGLMHVNKSELTKTLYRISNSIAFSALARSILGVGELEDGRRVLGQVKTSYTEALVPLPFTIQGVAHPATGQSVGRVMWGEPDAGIDVQRLFEDHRAENQGSARPILCATRLESILNDGPMFVSAVRRILIEEGFGRRTIDDGLCIAGVETLGRGRSARWRLPGADRSQVGGGGSSEATISEGDVAESSLRTTTPPAVTPGEEEGDA